MLIFFVAAIVVVITKWSWSIRKHRLLKLFWSLCLIVILEQCAKNWHSLVSVLRHPTALTIHSSEWDYVRMLFCKIVKSKWKQLDTVLSIILVYKKRRDGCKFCSPPKFQFRAHCRRANFTGGFCTTFV